MKVIYFRFISVSFILFTLILLIGNIDANNITYSGVVKDFDRIDQEPSLIIPVVSYGLNSNADDQKHLDIEINRIDIGPLTNGMVFPNTPVDVTVEVVGPTPAVVILLIDASVDDMNITYNIQKGEISISRELDNIFSLDADNVSTVYNATSRSWLITFPVAFKWEFPDGMSGDIFCIVKDSHGAIDSMTLEEAYTFESDLIISGEPKLSLDDPRYLTGDGFLKGGVILKISQLGVHFVGAPAVSPDPLDIEVGVEDSNGKYWPYRVQEREQLNMINFALPVPMYDEETEFHFRIMNAPGNSNITGSVEFKFFIDSTAPSLGDFKYSIIEDGVVLDWAFIEKGSGLNKDDVMYSLNIVDGIPGDWIGSGEISVNKRRMSFKIQMDGSNHKDVELAIQLTDVVGNRLYSDHDYHITFDPTPDHDLVIGQEVDFSPDPVIVNQVIHFRSTIINKGSMDENDILVEVMRDGGLVSRINIPFLAAGSTREIRWQWKAVEGLSMFKLIIDPYNTVDDLCPQNNERSFEISSDYLDVFVKDDTVFFSDEEAENMDLISISFNIGSIGSIESGPIKIILRQDEKFLGLFQLSSIFEEGSIRLTVDWKVDSSVHAFSIEVDPYNEILESVEDNNVVYFENPFYFEPLEDENEKVENDIEDTETHDSILPIIKTEEDHGQGGTIWSGPVIGNDEETDPVSDEDTFPAPVPPQEDMKVDLPPLLIPTMGAIIGTASVGITITAIRNEILRFKLIGLFVPLYSKLKKSNIEKGVRHEVLGYLKAKPGANYSELKRNLDLNDGSLVHHLRILEREEKIYSKKMGKYKLFYVSSYKRESSIQDYISPLQMRILDIINREPGMVPKKLSRMLDRSQTDMSYHLSELSRNGLLEKRKKGRNIHYYVNEEFTGALS